MQTQQTNNYKKSSRQEDIQLLKELDRRLCKSNLMFLMEEILKYPKMGKIHKAVEQFLIKLKINKKGIILLPRNHLKTTEVTIAWTVQQILINPNIRIFITNERLENSKSFLREIKSHFEKNLKLRALFGNLVNEEGKWTQDQIIIANRSKHTKEPTVQVGSLDTSLVSQHYDIIIGDDLVSRNNISTKEQIDKVKQYWKDLISLLETGGVIVDVGTRWNYDDLHGQLLRNQEYDRLIESCWDVNHTPIFPEKFTTAELQDIKNSIGSYDFSCLYENNPVDNEKSSFRRSYFENKYNESDLLGKTLNTFITIDNAPSMKKGTDFQGIIVNSVDTQGNWYLRWIERFKGNTPELIKRIFELYIEWNPIIIGIEQKAYEDLIKPYLDEEKRRRNQWPNVIELKDKGIRKEDRIRGRLQGRFESKAIFLQTIAKDNQDDLIDELVRFPVGQYDDLADALQYQDDIAYKPEEKELEQSLGLYQSQSYE